MNKTELVGKVAPVVGTQKLAKEAVDCVLQAITEWTEDAPPADDITVVVARRT